MSSKSQQRALTILIFTALAVAVGCGDGSRHKTRMLRDKAAGALNAKGAASPGSGSLAANPGSTGSVIPGVAGANVDPAVAKANDAKAKQISDLVAAAALGSPWSAANAEAGTYTLESVSTHFRLNGQSFAELFVNNTVVNSVLNHGTPITYGLMTNEADAGRSITLPLAFTVDLRKGPWTPTREGNDFKYKTQVGVDANGLKSMDNVDDKSQVSIAGDMYLMDVLAGSDVDGNGVKLNTTTVKTADGHLHILIRIDEKLIDSKVALADKSTAKQGSIAREILLSYKFAADASLAATAAAAPAATAPAASPAPAVAADAPAGDAAAPAAAPAK